MPALAERHGIGDLAYFPTRAPAHYVAAAGSGVHGGDTISLTLEDDRSFQSHSVEEIENRAIHFDVRTRRNPSPAAIRDRS